MRTDRHAQGGTRWAACGAQVRARVELVRTVEALGRSRHDRGARLPIDHAASDVITDRARELGSEPTVRLLGEPHTRAPGHELFERPRRQRVHVLFGQGARVGS